MLKNRLINILIIALLYPVVIWSQKNSSNYYDEFIENYKQLTLQQLLDTAEYHEKRNNLDTALIYYNIVINTSINENDVKQQNILIKAYMYSAQIYIDICDYTSAYNYNLKALLLCENTGNSSYKSRIYNTMGIIYKCFNRIDIANDYFSKSLTFCEDSTHLVVYLNNIGDNYVKRGMIDSSFYYLDKSLQISKQHNNLYLDVVFATIADGYQKIQRYDSAFCYFKLSLNEAIKNQRFELEAYNLSKLSNICLEMNKMDSALYYNDLSNTVAKKYKYLSILADNYLTLSKIEKLKRHTTKALEYFETYSHLKDSVFSTNKFGEINKLQRQYEISKTNQQIEQLVIEQQVKDRTIYYKNIIWYITMGVLMLVTMVLIIILYQKTKLKKAHKKLVENNVENFEYKDINIENPNIQDNTSEKEQKEQKEQKKEKKEKKDNTKYITDELMNKILTVMENPEVFCNPSFDINTLVSMTQSCNSYVSTAIKINLNKNFRSFLNSYRIKEAQKIFMGFEKNKYTIEYVSDTVGFKSRSSFYNAFKEVTGVNPKYYLEFLQEKSKEPENIDANQQIIKVKTN